MNKGPILKFTNKNGTPVFIDRSEIKGRGKITVSEPSVVFTTDGSLKETGE